MANPYRSEWKDKPAGYYARYEVKQRHDRKRQEARAEQRREQRGRDDEDSELPRW